MANNRPAPSLGLGYAQNAPPIRLHSQTLAPHASIFEAKNLCLISLLPLSHHLFTHPPPLNPWPSSVCPHWQVHLTHFSSSPLPVPKSRPLSPTRVQLQHILKPTFTPRITPLCRSLQWPPLSFRSYPPPPDDDTGTRHCSLADLPSPQVSPSRSLLGFAWTLDAQWLGVFGAFPHLFLCQVTMPHPLDSASPPVPSQPNLALVFSWCAGSFLRFLPVSLFSQVSIHPRKILWIRDLGLFHLWSHYLYPTLIHQNVGVADCRGPPLCSGLTLQTEVWGWRRASRGVTGLAALWLLVEYV